MILKKFFITLVALFIVSNSWADREYDKCVENWNDSIDEHTEQVRNYNSAVELVIRDPNAAIDFYLNAKKECPSFYITDPSRRKKCYKRGVSSEEEYDLFRKDVKRINDMSTCGVKFAHSIKYLDDRNADIIEMIAYVNTHEDRNKFNLAVFNSLTASASANATTLRNILLDARTRCYPFSNYMAMISDLEEENERKEKLIDEYHEGITSQL